MDVNRNMLLPYLIFDKPFKYCDGITLYPIKMKNIVIFQTYQCALTLRKDAIFQDKQIIKMGYWEFLKYAYGKSDLATEYDVPFLDIYYEFAINLLVLACDPDSKIEYNKKTLDIRINDVDITEEIFNDIRRIIILQNDIDFDPDEFMNIDTVKALEKARELENKKKNEHADIEDYIDSVVISLGVTEEYVSELSIRKFWRYVNRITKHEEYEACRSGELTGMVKFKQPLQHWMTSIEVDDKYASYKTDKGELKGKLNG